MLSSQAHKTLRDFDRHPVRNEEKSFLERLNMEAVIRTLFRRTSYREEEAKLMRLYGDSPIRDDRSAVATLGW